ncbi:zinc finger protein, putative [Ricinus communis]|uniref:Zinc finger protein, putative n=1 Tax=Ricinus communis TaxID=3988 RepID=B9RE80_RICCO|nr:zinc finger protein, putative [Ricinus communis]
MLKGNPQGDSCDSCHTAPCTLYCHTDSAYLCQNCDEFIHATNPLALQHDRVWICIACENAPATFTCQADAANLCINCDTEIHLANPLPCRHNRVPISPPPGIVPTSSTTYLDKSQVPLRDTENEAMANKSIEELEQDEADSWLLLDLDNNDDQSDSGFPYSEDVDEYLDLIELNSII